MRCAKVNSARCLHTLFMSCSVLANFSLVSFISVFRNSTMFLVSSVNGRRFCAFLFLSLSQMSLHSHQYAVRSDKFCWIFWALFTVIWPVPLGVTTVRVTYGATVRFSMIRISKIGLKSIWWWVGSTLDRWPQDLYTCLLMILLWYTEMLKQLYSSQLNRAHHLHCVPRA